MAQRKYFSHVSIDGNGLSDRLRAAGYGEPGDGWRAGEDLGWGTGERATPNALVDAWLGCDHHRRILLSPVYEEIGVGVASGRAEGHGLRAAGRDVRHGPGDDPAWIDSRPMTATAPSGARYGVTSMVAPLKRVLVRRPALTGDWDGAGWRTPDPAALERQHEAFVELLDGLGAQVEVADALDGQVDAVYMHDPLIVSAAAAASRSTWPSRPACASPATPPRRSKPSTSPCSARSRATRTPTAATASGSTTRPR